MSIFEDIDEVKEFLLWAKEERIKSVEVGGIKVEFSELAFIGEFQDLSEDKKATTAEPQGSTTPTNDEEPVNTSNDEVDEDLLFHSAR